MLTMEETRSLTKAAEKLTHEVSLLLTLSDDDRSGDFRTYCDVLTKHLPNIRITTERAVGNGLPSLGVTDRIRLHALPRGTELPPFLELLIMAKPPDGKATADRSVAELPAVLKLYVSPMCPFCPSMMGRLFAETFMRPEIQLKVIDAGLFSETAAADGVQSVPTLLLDGSFRWTGVIDPTEVFEVARHRDPAGLGVDSLRAMIAGGDAYRITEMMLREGKIFPAFVELLAHDEFSIRLGAMAAAEELAAQNAEIAGQLTAPLLERYPGKADQIRGDILYVLGETGDRSVLKFLQKVLAKDAAGEIREAAAEAVDRIRQRVRS